MQYLQKNIQYVLCTDMLNLIETILVLWESQLGLACMLFRRLYFCWTFLSSNFKIPPKNGPKKAWIFWFVYHRYCNTKCYLYNISFPTVLIQASITAYSTNLHEKLSKCLGLKLAIIHQLTLFACAIIWCHLLMHSNEKIFVWGM